MAHNTSGADKEMCDLMNKSINTILSGNSKKSPEEIESIMNAETWMNAKTAVEFGFADEIINTGKKVKTPKNASPEDLANIYNELINPKKNMSKINTLLKIGNSADESGQEAAIVALNNELTTTKAELEALKVANEARENEAKTALKTKATEMANAAQKSGKIKDSEVAGIIENASKDQASFDFVSNMVNRLGNTKEAKKIFDPANAVGTSNEKTYAELEKENPKALVEMYKNDRPKYDELLNEYKASK